MEYLSIKKWSATDRPREKLIDHGCRSLSDAELIAIILGSGTRELSAVELARKILNLSSNNLSELGDLSINKLMSIKGIGEAKAISIVATLELGRRRQLIEPKSRPTITSSKDASLIFQMLLSDIPHEEFWVAYLNRANILLDRKQISQGGISGTVTDVRLIMKTALELLASSIIICHNHPSGNMQPSEQDKLLTDKINNAADLFEIKLLDHIIVCKNKYLSFADEGLI